MSIIAWIVHCAQNQCKLIFFIHSSKYFLNTYLTQDTVLRNGETKHPKLSTWPKGVCRPAEKRHVFNNCNSRQWMVMSSWSCFLECSSTLIFLSIHRGKSYPSLKTHSKLLFPSKGFLVFLILSIHPTPNIYIPNYSSRFNYSFSVIALYS